MWDPTLSGRTVTVGVAVWRLLVVAPAPRELRLLEPPSSMERLAMLPEHTHSQEVSPC